MMNNSFNSIEEVKSALKLFKYAYIPSYSNKIWFTFNYSFSNKMFSVSNELFKKLKKSKDFYFGKDYIFINENLENQGIFAKFVSLKEYREPIEIAITFGDNSIPERVTFNIELKRLSELKAIFPTSIDKIYADVAKRIREVLHDKIALKKEDFNDIIAFTKQITDFMKNVSFEDQRKFLKTVDAYINETKKTLTKIENFRNNIYNNFSTEEKLKFEVDEF